MSQSTTRTEYERLSNEQLLQAAAEELPDDLALQTRVERALDRLGDQS